MDFPHVHDLARLLSILETAGETIPPTLREVERLTEYAVMSRYPGTFEPVTDDEYTETIAIAAAVLAWAERLMQEPT